MKKSISFVAAAILTALGAPMGTGKSAMAQMADLPSAPAPAIAPVTPPATMPATMPAAVVSMPPATAPTTQFTDPDVPDPEKLLGPLYSNKYQGIEFRPPIDCKTVPPSNDQVIAQYRNKDMSWSLRVSMATQDHPIPLTTDHDSDGNERMGMLDMAAKQIASNQMGTEVVRKDVTNVGDNYAGILIFRQTAEGKNYLNFQAIIQANEVVYYFITLECPAGAKQGDASEELAFHSFEAVIDSVKILDRTWIKREQTARLLRTRALFLDWREQKVTTTLLPQQWLRVQRGGKDVGWSYIEEMTSRQRHALNNVVIPSANNESNATFGDDGLITDEGFVIFTRSWMKGSNATLGKILQNGTELFSTFDRHLERWARVAAVTTPPAPAAAKQRPESQEQTREQAHKDRVRNSSWEFGQSLRQITDHFLVRPGVTDIVRDKNGHVIPQPVPAESYALSVQLISKNGNAPPIKRELPPFYIPEAYWHLLPRLLPLHAPGPYDEPHQYLFAVYVPQKQEVMLLYADVEAEKTVTIGNRTVDAIPVVERLGLEASPTTYYMSPDGRFLGMISQGLTPEDTVTMIPTDAQTLQKLWPDADLRIQQIEREDSVIANQQAESGSNEPVQADSTATPAKTGNPRDRLQSGAGLAK